MVANSFTEAVALGVAPLPHNRPLSVTVEYTNGLTLVFKDQSLRIFWEEFIRNYAVYLQASQGPTIPSEDMQEAFTRHVKGGNKNESND